MKHLFTTLFLLLLALSIPTFDSFSQSFYTGKIGTNLSIYGRVRIFSDSLVTRQIDRSSILVASAPNAVFDYKNDSEAIDTAKVVISPLRSDYEIYGSIDNSYASLFSPPSVLAKINIYGWQNVGGIVVKFTILNKESSPINGIVGMEIHPQIDGSYGLETVEYISSAQIVSLYRQPSSKITGYKILSAQLKTLNNVDYYEDYYLVEDSLYNWMNTGTIQTYFDAGGDGPIIFISQNEVQINTGDSTIMYLGIAVGSDQAELLTNMDEVVLKYNQLTSVQSDPSRVPLNYVLEQNYPNPFNPETSIKFSIPQREFVSLKVYNSLGQEIASPVNKEFEAGSYSAKFNADGLTSGVYFYTVRAGNFVQTKKMILVR